MLSISKSDVTRMKDNIKGLEKELEAAIETECYEEAARLRDAIRGLEEKVPEIALRKALKDASEVEDYEECARIRDEMKELGILLNPEEPSKAMSMTDSEEIKCSSYAVTRGIAVKVKSFYAPQMSSPLHRQYVFGYRVEIVNEGNEVVQLKSRHWVIQNATGQTEEVRGPGVIGEEPVLKPGESFTYTSVCPLSTTRGWMEGEYQMISHSNDREVFEVYIGRFGLDMSSPPLLS